MMVGVQKRKIQWAVSLFLVILYFSGIPAQAQYGGGSGEPNDTYLIYTAAQMNEIGANPNDWDKHRLNFLNLMLGVLPDTVKIPVNGYEL